MTWANMKSAKPRSGEMPANCCLFSGFTCKRRHTTLREKEKKLELKTIGTRKFSTKYFKLCYSFCFHLTSENKAADGRNESGQKWVERECSNQTAVNELYDAGKHDIEEISIDQLQFFRRIIHIFIVEFIENHTKISHFGWFLCNLLAKCNGEKM